jgi:hypothetical protein
VVRQLPASLEQEGTPLTNKKINYIKTDYLTIPPINGRFTYEGKRYKIKQPETLSINGQIYGYRADLEEVTDNE